MAIEVISVHVPKAAGNSFRDALTTTFGEAAVHLDYVDDPVDPCCQFRLDPEGCRRSARDKGFAPDVKVIHGHFHPSKYDHLKDAKRITFLRPPVENLISIYYFWKAFAGESHCLFRYVRDNGLSLLDLARIPALRNLYSKTYFDGVPLDRFDYIGSTESYPESLRAISQLLGVELKETRSNVNTFPNYQEEAGNLRADEAVLRTLRHHLREDLRFYEAAVRHR